MYDGIRKVKYFMNQRKKYFLMFHMTNHAQYHFLHNTTEKTITKSLDRKTI